MLLTKDTGDMMPEPTTPPWTLGRAAPGRSNCKGNAVGVLGTFEQGLVHSSKTAPGRRNSKGKATGMLGTFEQGWD